MTHHGLKPEIGQHLLINEQVMRQVVDTIPNGYMIFEIGAGPGLLTKHLVQKAKQVVAVEIDSNFEPNLSPLEQKSKNLQVIFSNALDVLRERDFKKLFSGKENLWIAGNIPYHITEPLMGRLIKLPIDGATFLIGAKFVNEISVSSDSEQFGKLTLLVNTFFKVEIIGFVNKSSFNPPPRTTSAIIKLVTKSKKELLSSLNLFVISELFLSADRGILVKNQLREAIIEYKEYQKKGEAKISGKPLMTKNEAREIINRLKIPYEILNKALEQLNNFEFRILSERLQNLQI